MVNCAGATLREALAAVEETRVALDRVTAGCAWELPAKPPEWLAWRAAWDRLLGCCERRTTWDELQALVGRR